MLLSSKDIIEYEGISNLSRNDYIFEEIEDISIIIDKDFNNDTIITKGTFNIELINMDSLISLENRDVFIFHLKINITVEYIENTPSSGIKIKEKEFITSKILEVKPGNKDNTSLGGRAYIVDGFIGVKDKILYSSLVLLLTLGGTSLC